MVEEETFEVAEEYTTEVVEEETYGLPDFYAEGDAPDLVPVPSRSAFAEDAADDRISEPVIYYDEEQGVVQDDGSCSAAVLRRRGDARRGNGIIGRREEYRKKAWSRTTISSGAEFYDEEAGSLEDDGIIAHNLYYDEEVMVAQDGDIFGEEQSYAEEGGQEPRP